MKRIGDKCDRIDLDSKRNEVRNLIVFKREYLTLVIMQLHETK